MAQNLGRFTSRYLIRERHVVQLALRKGRLLVLVALDHLHDYPGSGRTFHELLDAQVIPYRCITVDVARATR